MVSAHDSGSSGTGSSPGQEHCVCSWARIFTLINEYLCVLGIKLSVLGGGVTLRWTTSILSRGSSKNTTSRFTTQKLNRCKFKLYEPLA